MIRVVLTQLALFLLPLALYAGWLFLRRKSLSAGLDVRAIFWAAMLGVVISVGFLVAFGQRDTAPPGSRYVPPHMEDGTYVPGHFLPPEKP
jgi:hypothetical protein